MKAQKVLVLSGLLASIFASTASFAAGVSLPTQSFQWFGKVPTIDNNSDWQFKDPAGADVVDGILKVAKDGTFTSNLINTILVDTTVSNALAADAKMKLVDTTVIIGGTDYSQKTAANTTVKVNGQDMPIRTEVDLTGFGGRANFEISSTEDLSASVTAGEGALAAATIVVTSAS